LAAQPNRKAGGQIVLGSIHTEMTALLDDRTAPLYNRVTDVLDLVHWDIGLIMSILRDHTDEADNWFLRELRGRYDTVLKFVARHPGSSHGDLMEAMRRTSRDATNQIGGYLQTLSVRYRLIESKLPIFAKPTARRRRYYLSDNFLES